MYKDSRWAQEILAAQGSDGLWGNFHTLSQPVQKPLTTEQALRRLRILGFTIEDEPIERAVSYMSDCLVGKRTMPDKREKTHDWDIFTELMLSTWVRQFTQSDDGANQAAEKWAGIISAAFACGGYDRERYIQAYTEAFGKRPKGGRLEDFVSFYQVALTADQFDESTEARVFDYILHHESGLYYIYDKPILDGGVPRLPEAFASRAASRYIGALEILANWHQRRGELRFAVDWLMDNRNQNGRWDLGGSVSDGVYFPLSDSWRVSGTREADCTARIQKLLERLSL